MKHIRTSVSIMILLVLSGCSLWAPSNPAAVDVPVVRLAVNTQNAVSTFSKVGDVINYNYVVTNTGLSPLSGPVTITDAPRQASCPAVNTVGNGDNFLDLNESVTCTAAYGITDADFNAGTVINVATATVGGLISNQAGVTLTRSTGTPQPSGVLTLTKSASPTTYGQVGQTITYTFVITNVGTVPLGPDQFKISDSKLGATFNCGNPATTIAPSQSLSCSVPYIVTQGDMTAASLSNTATAAGAGHTSAPASSNIINLTITQVPPTGQGPTPSANLTPGSTIRHQVAVGEWLWQIVRCYGATFSEVRNANPQIPDPNFILPSMIVTVPRIGSAGTIYGPPCVTFHTVQSSDTWTSIATQYRADQSILQRVNPAGLVVGKQVKVPRNSAGALTGTAIPAPATTAPPTSSPSAERINFPAGQNSVSLVGIINPGQTLSYVLNAPQGHTLSIQLLAPANEVGVGVNGPSGIALKPLDASQTWTTTVTANGDHLINVASIAGNTSKSYTLTVSLTPPGVTPTVTPTATVTSTVAPAP